MKPPEVGSCKTCDAQIFFGQMSTGAMCPFDAAPTILGTWVIERFNGAIAVMTLADRLRVGAGSNRERYVTHFATCRDAAIHRKSEKTSRALELGL